MKQSVNADHRLAAGLKQVKGLLNSKQVTSADTLCASLLRDYPGSVELLLLYSRVKQQNGRLREMLELAKRANKLQPGSLNTQLHVIEYQIYCGEIDKALERLKGIETNAGKDHRLWCQLAEYYTHCSKHRDACRCYEHAVRLQADDAQALFNLAASSIAIGDLDKGEELLNKVIKINPHDYDAYQNRSSLRKQTSENNHIAELTRVLEGGVQHPAGEVQLCYALGKEYEDMEDYEQAFKYLQQGAAKRRSLMAYHVETDLAVIDRIIEVFNQTLLEKERPSSEKTGPVFVMGLPRSGTTLVDRIISSHSRVESMGEINDFAFALMRCVNSGGDKLSLVERSASIDFRQLGEEYCRSVRGYGVKTDHFIDKTPANYLYIGLIHLALPNARIVHLRRNPMDSCFAMFKTLFRMGYPFSYDLTDLGKYYLAYHKLMTHWREMLPGSFLDVDYEDLVSDQEVISRKMTGYCGLEWEEDCLSFHENVSPAATASAAQVRQPIYKTSVQRWRCYESQLAPLQECLQRNGIAV